MPRRSYTNLHETKTECACDRPLFIDETVLGMGVNCIKCGRAAERRLTSRQRWLVREIGRAVRRRQRSEREK